MTFEQMDLGCTWMCPGCDLPLSPALLTMVNNGQHHQGQCLIVVLPLEQYIWFILNICLKATLNQILHQVNRKIPSLFQRHFVYRMWHQKGFFLQHILLKKIWQSHNISLISKSPARGVYAQ